MCSDTICPPGILTALLERVISLRVAVLTLGMGDGAASQLAPCSTVSERHKSVSRNNWARQRQQEGTVRASASLPLGVGHVTGPLAAARSSQHDRGLGCPAAEPETMPSYLYGYLVLDVP